MSLGEPWCRAIASSAPGMISDTTRPIVLTVPSVGMNTVASPRPCWKSSPRVQAAGRAGGGQPLCADGRVELAERSLPPAEDVIAIDGLPDADGRRRRD